jgi:ribosomal-protein-alanine N-acetyltransferase
MILETERLTLRPLEADDADAVFRIMSHAEVMARWESIEIEDPDVVFAIVDAQVRATQSGEGLFWTMLYDGFIQGVCDISEIDWRKRRAEAGFILGLDAWRQGFGLEAMRAVVTHAAALGLKRLSARTNVGADRSEVILTQLGFRPDGYLRGHIQRGGERRDCRTYSLVL